MGVFSVVDACTRETQIIEVDTSLPGARIVRVLDQFRAVRDVPEELVLDNGPELTSKALDQWACEQHVRLQLIDPERRDGELQWPVAR